MATTTSKVCVPLVEPVGLSDRFAERTALLVGASG